MDYIVTENGRSTHTGSTLEGPVVGTLTATQNFVKINGYKVLTKGSGMSTPSHKYDYNPAIGYLYHSHNQTVNTNLQNFIKIEGVYVSIVGDNSNDADLTMLDNPGQEFVK